MLPWYSYLPDFDDSSPMEHPNVGVDGVVLKEDGDSSLSYKWSSILEFMFYLV